MDQPDTSFGSSLGYVFRCMHFVAQFFQLGKFLGCSKTQLHESCVFFSNLLLVDRYEM